MQTSRTTILTTTTPPRPDGQPAPPPVGALLRRLGAGREFAPNVYSTVDVLWVLYDRDPPGLPRSESTTRSGTAFCSRRDTRNVGIREQLMIGVAGGLALTGLRSVVHSYAPFLVERAYEQIKLDLNHQGASGVLVSVGASYDRAASGRTHLSPADVALIGTLDGWTVQVPGHPDEVPALLRAAVGADDLVYLRLPTRSNDRPQRNDGSLQVVRDGGASAPLIVVVGRCSTRRWRLPRG